MSDGRTALRIGTWNTYWAKPGAERGRRVADALAAPGCDILCVTEGYAGILPVVGVCIPWRDAHVRTGRKDRGAWQDHESWLTGFAALPYRRAGERTVVLGDFNQPIPRRRQPKRIYAALRDAFAGLAFATAGELAGTPELAIDHIAHTADLVLADDIRIWPKLSAGTRFSDHIGVRGEFVLSPPPRRLSDAAAARRPAGNA